MRKLGLLILTTCLLLTLSSLVGAEVNNPLDASFQFVNSSITLDPFVTDTTATITEWTGLLNGTFEATEDLIIHLQHAYSVGRTLKVESDNAVDIDDPNRINRSLTQGAAAYKLLDDEDLTIYAGLGYKFIGLTSKHELLQVGSDGTAEKPVEYNLVGRGFIGHVDVAIDVIDNLTAHATISGTPWLKWEFTRTTDAESKSTKDIDGAAYNYQLALNYQFKEGWGLRAGYAGGNFSSESFDHDPGSDMAVKASFSGLTGGVSYQF